MSEELCRVAVSAVIIDDGRLLVVQRGQAPHYGAWALPGGAVEYGETVAQALTREVAEETGLSCVIGTLVGFSEVLPKSALPPEIDASASASTQHYVVLAFEATLLDDAPLRPGDDALDARWVPLDDVAYLDMVEGLVTLLQDAQVIKEL